ncbi:hypothetical protein MTO96_031207 [Rhipicephalus appendiculatus]
MIIDKGGSCGRAVQRAASQPAAVSDAGLCRAAGSIAAARGRAAIKGPVAGATFPCPSKSRLATLLSSQHPDIGRTARDLETDDAVAAEHALAFFIRTLTGTRAELGKWEARIAPQG